MIAGSKSLATPRSVLTGLQPSFAKMGTNSPAAAMKALTSIRISGFDIKGSARTFFTRRCVVRA